jgi:hypothetical protein
MFMIAHASELEVASLRARLRWTEAIDDLLAGGEMNADSTSALMKARSELADLRVALSHEDLHGLARIVRTHRDQVPARGSAESAPR